MTSSMYNEKSVGGYVKSNCQVQGRQSSETSSRE